MLVSGMLVLVSCQAAAPITRGGFTLPVGASQVRVIETTPFDAVTPSSDPLQDVPVRVVDVTDGVIHLELSHPVLVEEGPFPTHDVRPNPAFGAQLVGQVNGLLGDAYQTFEQQATRQERILDLVARAGVGIIRDMQSYDTKWWFIENTARVPDFAYADLLLAEAHSRGLEVIFRLTLHRDPLAADGQGPPSSEAEYVTYVGRAAERYDGDADLGCTLAFPDCYVAGDGLDRADAASWASNRKVEFWETLKEPEPYPRNRVGNDALLTPTDSAHVLQLAADTIRNADQSAKIYFSGMGAPFDTALTSYSRESYYDEMLSLGGGSNFDVAGIDAYVYDVKNELRTYGGMLADAGVAKPMWVGQTGASDVDDFLPYGHTTQAQIDFMTEVYARGFAGGAQRIIWGDFILEPDPFGTRRQMQTALLEAETWTLKPAYFTFRLLSSVLRGFVTAEEVADNAVKFTFADRSPVYVVWPGS
jgi:hypothetical protein